MPEAAAAQAKAGLASRTNTLFSMPMLFFMGASAHLGGLGPGSSLLRGRRQRNSNGNLPDSDSGAGGECNQR